MADPRTVLAIDTATQVCVGVAVDGGYVAGEVVAEQMAHVEQLMPTVTAVLSAAGIAPTAVDEVVIGLGPGPFTGLRVGVVTAQVLALTAGARLHGICTHDAIAAHHVEARTAEGRAPDTDFLVATDARRKELYWARYAATGERLEGPSVDHPDQLPALPVVGPGAGLYPGLEVADGPRTLDPRVLAVQGPRLPDAGTTPLYLRRPDAAVPTRRKSVLVRRPERSGPRP